MPMPYTKIELNELDSVRKMIRAAIALNYINTGEKYTIRTFYLGPRKRRRGSYQATTNKSDAYAAKIAVYKVENGYPVLFEYL